MLHILLTILKIIGIVLLVLLSIVLTVSLLILFVPVRYRINGQKDEESMAVICKMKWLFGFLTFIFSYQDKEKLIKLKILGIDLFKILDMRKEKKKTTDKLQKKEDTKKNTDVKKTESQPDITIKDIEQNETKEKQSFLDKIKSLPMKVADKVRKIKLTITNIYDKINYWKEFLTDERTKVVIILVKKHLMKLLKHIFPRNIKGEVTYGFDDPYKTGQVLAGVSAIYPLYADRLIINPDFSKEILVGSLEFKGRVYLFFVLKYVLVILFNKNIQYIIHTFRNKEDS